MDRCLYIERFRNIGVTREQKLDLNPNFNETKGGLVILIGHNNIGKTNYVKALGKMSFAEGKGLIDKKMDTTSLDKTHVPPTIKLQVYNQVNIDSENNRQLVYEYEPLDEKGNLNYIHISNDYSDKNEWSDESLNFVTSLINRILKNSALSKELDNDNQLKLGTYYFSNKNGTEFLDYDFIVKLHAICMNDQIYKANYAKDKDNIDNLLNDINEKHPISSQRKLEEKTGVDIFPKVIDLPIDENKFSSSKGSFKMKFDDGIPPSNPNDFFRLLFKMIGYDYHQLLNAYGDAREFNSPGDYKKQEEIINSLINEKFIEQINDAFPSDDGNKYSASVCCEGTQIFFDIRTNTISQRYDQTSEGFKWFFTFYMYMHDYEETLRKGDIVILDDPCVLLHDSGIAECCNLLRKFAEDNQVTIVITTHRPAFINLDYLEEVRVVCKRNNEAVVRPIFNNKFDGEDDDDNSLKFILDALSTPRNALVDTNTQHIVYCEGQTDYCYLTGYKQYLKHEGKLTTDISFIMLHGVGASDKVVKKVKVFDKTPFFFIDGDNEGMGFYDANVSDESIEILKINSIDSKYHEIEDAFEQGTKDKYNLSKKTFQVAVRMKHLISTREFKTKTNSGLSKVYQTIEKCVNSLTTTINSSLKELKRPVKDEGSSNLCDISSTDVSTSSGKD